jgi:uncharacterized membrane protein
MDNRKNLSLHYLALAGIIALGAALRFWYLDLKPLWLDEVLTALLSLGHRYKDVPLEVVFAPSTLQELFALQPNRTCAEIANAVATESTHPPLFFCLMHQWLNWVEPLAQPLSWKLRALPALVGTGAIAAIYALNRIVFSPTAGLMGAAFMAVSPFAVYLSQEARHYTLPMLLILLALLGLMQIQHAFYIQKRLPHPIVWLFWGITNSIGCYVHYFFILAFIAQILTLTGLMYWRRRMLPKGSWVALMLVVCGVGVSYLPWFSVLLGSVGRSETGWLPQPQHLAPLYQTVLAWLSMIIALPVENQPLWIQVPAVLLTIVFGGWVGWQGIRGFKRLWRQQETHLAMFTLSCFTLCVLLQFMGIIYLLGKDITVAPRYHFVYYPAICALLGASFTFKRLKVGRLNVEGLGELNVERLNVEGSGELNVERLNVEGSGELNVERLNVEGSGELNVERLNVEGSGELNVERLNVEGSKHSSNLQPANLQPANVQPANLQPANVQPSTHIQPATLFLSLSLLSCIFVVSNLAFLKSFHPQQVARNMYVDRDVPIAMVVGYQNFQDVALGLSFALAIDRLHRTNVEEFAEAAFVFLHPEQFYESVWQKLAELPALSAPRLNLWVVAPGLRRRQYPQQLALGSAGTAASGTNPMTCTIDPSQHYRIGVPYQLYRCVSASRL